MYVRRRINKHVLSAPTVSDSILPTVRHVRTSKEAWIKISPVFEQKGLSAQVFLRRRLVNLRFEEGESMQSHLNTIRDLVDELSAINVHVKDRNLLLLLSVLYLLVLTPSLCRWSLVPRMRSRSSM